MLKLFKDISVYTIGSILTTSVSFLLLPIYTRVLQPADYGQLELVYLVAAILSILYGLKVELGYTRIYFLKDDKEFRKTLFFTGQGFNFLCSIIFIALIFSNIDRVSGLILNFENGSYFLKLICISTMIEVLTYIPYNNLRLRFKSVQYVGVSLLNLLATVSSTIIFVVLLRYGVAGVLYGKIIGSSVMLLHLYFLTWNEFHLRFSLKQLWPMLAFSVFLIPSNLSSLILNMSNRYFLSEYQNLSDVGLFSLGAKIAAVIPLLITEPVKKAFSPYIFNLSNEPDKCKSVLSDFIRYFFLGLSFFVLAISVFANDLIYIMADKSYHGSGNIVFVLGISNLLLGLASIIVLAIHITRKTWIITLTWVISSIANIFLNIWLIPLYGRIGAAYATMFSVGFILILYIVAAIKTFPFKLPYFSFIKVFILLILFNQIALSINYSLILSITIKLGLLLVYLVILYFLPGIISAQDKARITEALRKYFSK